VVPALAAVVQPDVAVRLAPKDREAAEQRADAVDVKLAAKVRVRKAARAR
jgi:hypothetical protein